MRKAERIAVDEPARLHPNSWSSVEARVLDCSETGFSARCDARVGVGDLVTLEVPGVGPANAYVSWCRGRRFGAQFVEPIAVAQAAMRPIDDEKMLARLLVQRAAAHMAGHSEHERDLRQRIAEALPVRRS